MATIYHEAEEQFTLQKESNNLELQVTTGNGQGGGIVTFFENELLTEVNGKYEITNNSKIGKWLTVIVAIKDKLTQTNWTNVTISLKEIGAQEQKYQYSRELANHLDTIVYTIKIKVVS